MKSRKNREMCGEMITDIYGRNSFLGNVVESTTDNMSSVSITDGVSKESKHLRGLMREHAHEKTLDEDFGRRSEWCTDGEMPFDVGTKTSFTEFRRKAEMLGVRFLISEEDEQVTSLQAVHNLIRRNLAHIMTTHVSSRKELLSRGFRARLYNYDEAARNLPDAENGEFQVCVDVKNDIFPSSRGDPESTISRVGKNPSALLLEKQPASHFTYSAAEFYYNAKHFATSDNGSAQREPTCYPITNTSTVREIENKVATLPRRTSTKLDSIYFRSRSGQMEKEQQASSLHPINTIENSVHFTIGLSRHRDTQGRSSTLSFSRDDPDLSVLAATVNDFGHHLLGGERLWSTLSVSIDNIKRLAIHDHGTAWVIGSRTSGILIHDPQGEYLWELLPRTISEHFKDVNCLKRYAGYKEESNRSFLSMSLLSFAEGVWSFDTKTPHACISNIQDIQKWKENGESISCKLFEESAKKNIRRWSFCAYCVQANQGELKPFLEKLHHLHFR